MCRSNGPSVYLYLYLCSCLEFGKSRLPCVLQHFATVLERKCILMPLFALSGRRTEYKIEYISSLLAFIVTRKELILDFELWA